MTSTGAIFSRDKQYRYVLWRVWDDSLPMVNIIGLNPSTADEIEDDPTMRRCGGFAKAWGFGGFYMTNLFAYRSTLPRALKKALDPIGKDNDEWLLNTQRKSGRVVFAWGVHGAFRDRDKEILRLLKTGYVIKLTKGGHPCHPLYLRSGLILKKFEMPKSNSVSADLNK